MLIKLIIERNKLNNEAEIELYTSNYSTFFEEFKTIGISTWIFYVLYIIRRVILIVSIDFIQDGLLQLSIALMCSLSVFFI